MPLERNASIDAFVLQLFPSRSWRVPECPTSSSFVTGKWEWTTGFYRGKRKNMGQTHTESTEEILIRSFSPVPKNPEFWNFCRHPSPETSNWVPTLQPRPERLSSSVEKRPKGMIECLCRMGLLTCRIRTTCATTILTYARVGVWDSLMRHLCGLNCPKCGFPARNCLRGCLGYVDRNAYAWAYAVHLSPKCCFSVSLRNPSFCLHQAAIWHNSC